MRPGRVAPSRRARPTASALLVLALSLLAAAPSAAFTIVFELLAPWDDELTGLTMGQPFEVRARASGDPLDGWGWAAFEVDHFVASFPNGDFVAERQGAPGEIPGMSLTLRWRSIPPRSASTRSRATSSS